jgi:hypothetical protein
MTIEGIALPGRIVQEVVEPLTRGTGHEGCQHREGLGVLAGQPQPAQLVA